MRRALRAALLTVAIWLGCPWPATAQSVQPSTQIAVVYDATSGAIDEIVVPDHEGELEGPLKASLAIANGVLVKLSIAQVRANGLPAALAAAAPIVPTLQAQAAAAAVAAALAAPTVGP